MIEDGNFHRWIRWSLIVIGISAVYIAVQIITRLFQGAAPFTNRAAMLKIKPFDNSYRKARESYKSSGDDEDQPE
ncbi:hypothetical protein WS58_29795 [Burkholderia pseudomultivorans]|nr:hypothetical protein WS58_29795 [Burkholderia pseudomultivorans]